MNIYQQIIPLMLVSLFFNQQFSFADSLPFLNPDDVIAPHDYSLLTEKYRIENLFGSKKADKSDGAAASKSSIDTEKLHKYLGYTTVFLAGVTAVTSGNEDVHCGAAYSTVAASLGAVTTGYLAHGDRFTFEYGIFTEDNNHILLGTLGALGCIVAVISADSDGGHGHDGIGIAGGSAMAISVVTIRW